MQRVIDLVLENEDQEVGGIEQAVGHDGRQQTFEGFIQINQQHGKNQQRHKSDHVEMHQREQRRTAPQSQPSAAQVLEGGVENAAKERLLHHRSQHHRDGAQNDLFPGIETGVLQFLNQRLLRRIQMD